MRLLANWLCLALVLFTGVVPAQGFVLCVESDGCVRIEIKLDERDCRGCDEHLDEPAAPQAPSDAHEDMCSCTDFDVPGTCALHRLRANANEFCAALFTIAPPPALVPVQAFHLDRAPCPIFRPRPPDALRLHRSVVILR